jgi:pimeloyl-ACP methyl ester carboxylesterase
MSKNVVLCLVLSCLLFTATAKLNNQKTRYDPLRFMKNSVSKVCGDALFESLVKPAGYPYQSYTTVTDDGYVLKLFRIQKKNEQIVKGKPVVMLQHGLIDSADNWVINGDKGSLGFVLANAGYDVWLTNSRGNKYSRLNQNISPLFEKFWNYSFQEMGEYDVKANIEFILRMTNQEKLVYVGHSQGTSQIFAALGKKSTADFVNKKVKKFIALAPIVYLANSPSKLLSDLSESTLIVDAAKLFGVQEWLPGACSQTSAQSEFEHYVCALQPFLCDFVLSIADFDPKYDNQKMLPVFVEHAPSGTSLRTILHYQQFFVQKDKYHPTFSMYDFGAIQNVKIYGQKTPPEFDLSNIGIPIRGFVGLQDLLGDPKDNSILKAKMQALGKDYKEYIYDNVGHMTFMWALDPTKMFNDILYEIATA